MNNKPLILVVEDDAAVRSLMAVTLDTQGYRYHLAGNGGAALIEASTQQPAVMLLDLGLPDMEGVDIIRRVRDWTGMPIIVISARSEDADTVDVYMTKLRSKLSECESFEIQTVHGLGYKAVIK